MRSIRSGSSEVLYFYSYCRCPPKLFQQAAPSLHSCTHANLPLPTRTQSKSPTISATATHLRRSILVREFIRHMFAIESHQHHHDDKHRSTPFSKKTAKTSYPVAFSNIPLALSVTFSFTPRSFCGSTLPWPNFFSTASKPVDEGALVGVRTQ